VKTVANGATTEFVFDASGERVSEWNAATHAQLQGSYYWQGKPLAYYTTAADTSAAVGIHFEHQNYLGTERMRTMPTGPYNSSSPNYAVEANFADQPFGDNKLTIPTGAPDTDANHYAFLDSDKETLTDHADYRQYSNAQGRWMAPDPYDGSYDSSNPQSLNRYVYAMNSPLSYLDPSGLYTDENGNELYTIYLNVFEIDIDVYAYSDHVNDPYLFFYDPMDYVNPTTTIWGPSVFGGGGGQIIPKPCNCFNAQAFANKLDATAHNKSTGWCGRQVGKALAAGGANVGSHNGGAYGPYLVQVGFNAVSPVGYTPQIGDVAIFGSNSQHDSGHAAGYDGQQWVSDFFQGANPNPYPVKSSAGPLTLYRSGCKCQ
jgi:RHS repeat-associated protein